MHITCGVPYYSFFDGVREDYIRIGVDGPLSRVGGWYFRVCLVIARFLGVNGWGGAMGLYKKLLSRKKTISYWNEADGMRSVPESPGTLLYLPVLRGIYDTDGLGGCSVQSFETQLKARKQF